MPVGWAPFERSQVFGQPSSFTHFEKALQYRAGAVETALDTWKSLDDLTQRSLLLHEMATEALASNRRQEARGYADLQQSLLTEDVDNDHRVQILGIAAEMYV